MNIDKFLGPVDGLIKLYKDNGGKIDDVLAKAKGLFGKKEDPKQDPAQQGGQGAGQAGGGAGGQGAGQAGGGAGGQGAGQQGGAAGAQAGAGGGKGSGASGGGGEPSGPVTEVGSVAKKIHTYVHLPTGVKHKAVIPQQVTRCIWSIYDQPDPGSWKGHYALTNVPKKAEVSIVVETKFMDDGEKLKCVIHEWGKPDNRYEELSGDVKDCQWVSKKIKLEDLDKKKKFTALETPLVATVKIEKFGIEASTMILVVLNEQFVFSM
jgi:hypothetical protein